MLFSSLVFLFCFLPALLAVYYAVPHGWRNTVLLVAGLLFGAWGQPAALIPLAFCATAAFLLAKQIEKRRTRAWLCIGIATVLLPLVLFKYTPLWQGELPQGISFYTFSLLSYLCAVWWRRAPAAGSPLELGSYATLFPMLGAGPILCWSDTRTQILERKPTAAKFGAGVCRFCCGLGKKVLLANALAEYGQYYRALLVDEPTVLGAWLVALLFPLHLYYDFSGYTDMALGIGRLFGFSFPENFDYPFTSCSITAFWRRWHISLSRWFRDHVYIPLGGNRCGRARQCLNLAVVWCLTGIWHGAQWNFLLWGAYFGVLIMLEHFVLRRRLEAMPRALAWGYTSLLVLVSFVLFSYSDLAAGWQCLRAMIGGGVLGFSTPVVGWQTLHLLPLLAIAAVGSTPLPRRLFGALCYRAPALLPVCTILLLTVCVAYLLDSSFLPFAYLNF